MFSIVTDVTVNQALTVASLVVFAVSCALLLLKRTGSGTLKGQRTDVPAVAASHADAAVDPNKPCVRILFGTQTGTAERFAKQLGNELKRKYVESTHIDVVDLEHYNAQARLHKEQLVLFVVATYGDGEPTDNAADFYSWLTTEATRAAVGETEGSLQNVSYGVFGLGNKQYEHFNAVGKKVHKCLGTLGATAIVGRGDGDDDDCIDDDFDKWCSDLMNALEASTLVGSASTDAALDSVNVATDFYEVTILPKDTQTVGAGRGGSGVSVHDPAKCVASVLRELHTRSSDRSCVHAELAFAGTGVTYEHGDHVGILPQNSPAVVREVLTLLNHDADTVFTLRKPANSSLLDPFPCPTRLDTAVSCYADVLSTPHKEALLALSVFATDKHETDELRALASHENKQVYHDTIAAKQLSLLEVLRKYSSAKPSLGAFFGTVAPRLQPRFYSISSSPRMHPASIHVTCAVVRDQLASGRVHEGVCSTWLQRMATGTHVPIFIRRSHFKLPKDPACPVIMVGPGTGLAPFRGFLQERQELLREGARLGPAVLYFGCRNRAHDYIYEAELQGFLASGALSALHVAFSRDQTDKVYVQHQLQRDGASVCALLDTGAHLYVCGDAKHMARDVQRTLVAVLQAARGCSGTAAEAALKELADAGRYLRDVW